MNIRIFVPVLTLVGAALVAATPARAAVMASDVVNVDFNTDVSSNPNPVAPASPTYSGQAAGPVTAGSTWNAIVLGEKLNNGVSPDTTHNFGPTTAGTLVDSGGGATTLANSLTVELDDIRQYYAFENQLSPANGGDLLNDFAYMPVNRTSSTLKIGGVPGGTYDLYLYSENGNYQSQTSTFTIVTTETANNTNPSTGVFTLNRNYVRFTGLSAFADNSTFTVTFVGALNGFQLVQTSVPEPSNLVLIALAGLPLVRRFRDARRCPR